MGRTMRRTASGEVVGENAARRLRADSELQRRGARWLEHPAQDAPLEVMLAGIGLALRLVYAARPEAR
jgi:hypothetical protein